jgi:hypothetical protein
VAALAVGVSTVTAKTPFDAIEALVVSHGPEGLLAEPIPLRFLNALADVLVHLHLLCAPLLRLVAFQVTQGGIPLRYRPR